MLTPTPIHTHHPTPTQVFHRQFQMNFMNEKFCTLIQITLNSFPIDSALVG